MNRDTWGHPLVLLCYFLPLLLGILLFQQPVFLALSLLLAVVLDGIAWGKRGVCHLAMAACIGAAAGAFYAATHHFGTTVLWYTPVGNPVTAQALLYAGSLLCRITAAALWCAGASAFFTTDKVLNLTARISPRLARGASILLRIGPRMAAEYRAMRDAAAGVPGGRGGVGKRTGMLVTWLIDTLRQTAAAMRCRGSGLKKRGWFAPERLGDGDRLHILWITLCVGLLLDGFWLDQTRIWYTPRLVMNPVTPASFLFYGAYLALGLSLPVRKKWQEWKIQRNRRKELA